VDSIVLGVAAAMFDGNGRKVARFDIAPHRRACANVRI
jgi:hypothetical protein